MVGLPGRVAASMIPGWLSVHWQKGAEDILLEYPARDCNERQHRAAYAHQHEKAQHLLVFDEQCHCRDEFYIAASNRPLPEQPKSGAKDGRGNRQAVPGRHRITGERNARQAEHSNSEAKSIGNAPGPNIPVSNHGEKDNCSDGAGDLHSVIPNVVPSRWQVGNGVRIADRHSGRALRSGNGNPRECGADVCEQISQVGAERLGTDSYRKGHKYNKHCIFSGSRATIVAAKATDQTEHL
jgi:hypothetical protein